MEILLIEITLFLMMVTGVYLFWHPLASDACIRQFGVWPTGKPKEHRYESKARSDAFASEITRFAFVVAGSTLILFLFRIQRNDIMTLLSDWRVQLSSVLLSLTVVVYVAFIGPRKVARSEDSRLSLREHVVPYLGYLPCSLAVWSGIAPLTVFAILRAAAADLRLVETVTKSISTVTVSRTPVTTADLQRAGILAVDLGNRLAEASQKYVAAGWITLLYLVAEQRTNMAKTIFVLSVDLMKYAAWIVFVIAIAFGMVYLPSRYGQVHSGAFRALAEATETIIGSPDLDYLISVQTHLESHGLEWLLLRALTGFANLLVLFALGAGFLLRNVLFKGLDAFKVLGLLVPSGVFRAVCRLADQLGYRPTQPQSGEKT